MNFFDKIHETRISTNATSSFFPLPAAIRRVAAARNSDRAIARAAVREVLG